MVFVTRGPKPGYLQKRRQKEVGSKEQARKEVQTVAAVDSADSAKLDRTRKTQAPNDYVSHL
jgi:hypothetical protein